jgi:hypothetical protein
MQITAAQLTAFLAAVTPVIVPWLTAQGFAGASAVLTSMNSALSAGGAVATLVVALINDVLEYVVSSVTVWLPNILQAIDGNPALAAIAAKL